MMRKAHGIYTAKRDAQTYACEVTWRQLGQSIVWGAKVSLNSVLVALPRGELVLQDGMDPIRAVWQELVSTIEHRMSAD
jgi:hypothetical protein